MYIYDISYGTCEESECVQLSHTKKFTNAQLVDMIADVALEMIRDDPEEYSRKDFEGKKRSITFQQMFIGLDDMLMKKFGFKSIKFQAKFDVFGWADMFDIEDWDTYRGETDKKFASALNRKRKQLILKDKGVKGV